MPPNVIAHCKSVAAVAYKLGLDKRMEYDNRYKQRVTCECDPLFIPI